MSCGCGQRVGRFLFLQVKKAAILAIKGSIPRLLHLRPKVQRIVVCPCRLPYRCEQTARGLLLVQQPLDVVKDLQVLWTFVKDLQVLAEIFSKSLVDLPYRFQLDLLPIRFEGR